MNAYTQRNEPHLTEEQFGELIERAGLDRDDAAAEIHLQGCDQCRAELNSMRQALALFRESATTFAERELARTPRLQTGSFQPMHRGFSPSLVWAAAGLLVIASGLPLSLHKAPTVPVPHSAASSAAPAPVSDEALLDDINREVSASVPASMQALEDPTGSTSVPATDAQTSSTRKN